MRAVVVKASAVSMSAWLALACVEPHAQSGIVQRDQVGFEMQVLPVLIRDCGFHACHGSSERFFQVFGPGHGRLSPTTRPLDPLTPAEIEHSLTRALSMIDSAHLEASPLLRKPLAVAAGGAGHEGTDALGRDVYQSKQDPDYQILSVWVIGGGGS